MPAVRYSFAIAATVALFGCDGPQSAFVSAGRGADDILTLTYWMAGGAVVIWCSVIGLTLYAIRIAPQPHDDRRVRLWVIGGGVIIPTLVLTILLIFGLSMLPGLLRPAPAEALTIDVSGEQWWWRVRYVVSETETVELANEIRLPVDEPVQFRLDSVDVIHAFWIPSLGGKVDMIPGRRTQLALEPTRTGTYRGVCAEYCGASHALMAFDVVVTSREEFDRWLEQQRSPAVEPTDPLAARGRDVFVSRGCGACHTIRGTTADGVIGPDLTHVGSRTSIGASLSENDAEGFRTWIAHTRSVKPEVRMPQFDTLTDDELEALAAYLKGLL